MHHHTNNNLGECNLCNTISPFHFLGIGTLPPPGHLNINGCNQVVFQQWCINQNLVKCAKS